MCLSETELRLCSEGVLVNSAVCRSKRAWGRQKPSDCKIDKQSEHAYASMQGHGVKERD